MKNSTLRIWLIIFGTLSFLLIIFAIFSPVILLNPSPDWYPKIDYNSGSIISRTLSGFMMPFISISAALLTFIAFLVQYQANQKIQTQFQVQEVDQLFSEMLRLHKENVNEFSIQGYDYLEKKMSGTGNIVREAMPKLTEKRKVFVTMITELNAIQKVCNHYLKSKYDPESINQLAYSIFFFGIKSENIESKNVLKEEIHIILSKLDEFSRKHKATNSYNNNFYISNGPEIKVYIKYTPFSGHENRLGHYYRHLFSTVDFVVKKEKESVISHEKSKQYLKLLRAQLSNDEQLLLYYNYRIGFGQDWDKLGKRNNRFLTDYKMIHNIPLKKVSFTEKAEIHFSEYIKNKNSQLFEQL